jgi:hypothetical protein
MYFVQNILIKVFQEWFQALYNVATYAMLAGNSRLLSLLFLLQAKLSLMCLTAYGIWMALNCVASHLDVELASSVCLR